MARKKNRAKAKRRVQQAEQKAAKLKEAARGGMDAAARERAKADRAHAALQAQIGALKTLRRGMAELDDAIDAVRDRGSFVHSLASRIVPELEGLDDGPAPVEAIIRERDEAVDKAAALSEMLAKAEYERDVARAEASKLRLALDEHRKDPPKWLVRLAQQYPAGPPPDERREAWRKIENWAYDTAAKRGLFGAREDIVRGAMVVRDAVLRNPPEPSPPPVEVEALAEPVADENGVL